MKRAKNILVKTEGPSNTSPSPPMMKKKKVDIDQKKKNIECVDLCTSSESLAVVTAEVDKSSTSCSAPLTKKKKKKSVVIDETKNIDCIDLCTSSESLAGCEDVIDVTPLGKKVKTEEESGTSNHQSSRYHAYTDSERNTIGVSVWSGVRQERRRFEAYHRRFSAQAFAKFDDDIWQHYKNNAQDAKIYHRKMAVRMSLLEVAQRVFPGCLVHLLAVGSSINGCGSYNSDMDLCLMLYNRDGSTTDDKKFAQAQLGRLFSVLKHRCSNIVATCQFIRGAVVPIIKLETVGPDSVEVDINLNNKSGVYNSHLMHYYSRVDDRFPVLCLAVKHWAIKAGVNDSLTGTWNSYSLILLVLHYLQCGVHPAVLPNLQYLCPAQFSDNANVLRFDLWGEFEPALPQRVLNDQSVGELLIGFFQYYSKFDFHKFAISIRRGEVFERSGLTTRGSIYIEEPFDGKNTARCVQGENMRIIKMAFEEAAEALEKRPSLRRIRVEI